MSSPHHPKLRLKIFFFKIIFIFFLLQVSRKRTDNTDPGAGSTVKEDKKGKISKEKKRTLKRT